jgi:AcrR family transcriptional regulator
MRASTQRAYPGTVGELRDRRARKKAETREHVRGVAHRLFAEHGFDAVTIADIARDSGVAVQTVFNHFATKEELFFDGRVDWVEWPAQAVRARTASTPPLTALREALVGITSELVGSHTCAVRRNYVATIERAESLRVQERELVHEAEVQLAAALLDAWSEIEDDTQRPADPVTIAPLVAAMWISAGRALVTDQRPRLAAGADPRAVAAEVSDLADRTLRMLEESVALTHARTRAHAAPEPGWPVGSMCRAS